MTMKVYEAINRVQAALAKTGVAKDRKNQQQGYMFRGIDDMYAAISPLLAANGLCILPRMTGRTCEERQSAKGGALFYVTVEAEFDFVSTEDGSKHTIRMFGEAMDSGDKATNKAQSAAYKYAVMQAFAIPTEGDNDTENHTHEVASRKAAAPVQSVRQQLSAALMRHSRPETREADWNALTAWLSDGEYVIAAALKDASDATMTAMLAKLEKSLAAGQNPNTMADAYVCPAI